MHEIKKDPSFRKVIQSRQEFIDTEGYAALESTDLAMDQGKFLLNGLFSNKLFPED